MWFIFQITYYSITCRKITPEIYETFPCVCVCVLRSLLSVEQRVVSVQEVLQSDGVESDDRISFRSRSLRYLIGRVRQFTKAHLNIHTNRPISTERRHSHLLHTLFPVSLQVKSIVSVIPSESAYAVEWNIWGKKNSSAVTIYCFNDILYI